MTLSDCRGNVASDNISDTNESLTDPSPPPARKWKKGDKLNTSAPFQNAEGPRLCEFENCRQPVDFFLKYWDRDIEENILQQTNQYQIQKGRTGQHIILEELRGFLAVNMVMGYHVLPSYRHHWSTQPDLGVPLVASVMTKNRFVHILGNLHINNITGPRNDDKLWKVRPLGTSLNNNFVKLYDIKKTQSVDESMILFKGRSCLKQYCPLKPIKRGFKMWEMADPDGYITRNWSYGWVWPR